MNMVPAKFKFYQKVLNKKDKFNKIHYPKTKSILFYNDDLKQIERYNDDFKQMERGPSPIRFHQFEKLHSAEPQVEIAPINHYIHFHKKCTASLKSTHVIFDNNPENELKYQWLIHKIGFYNLLVKLSLEFNESMQATTIFLNGLVNSIKQLKELRELYLNFADLSNPTYRRVQALFGGFRTFTMLRSLHLDINKSRILNDENLICLGNALGFLTNLEVLHLNFSHCENIITYGISYLIKKLPTQKLFNFHLNLEWFGEITNDMLYELENKFRDLKSLEQLTLNLSGNRFRGSYNERTRLSNVLFSLNNLSSLDLVASHNSFITNDEIRAIANALEKFNLSNLVLNFDGCKNITDDGLKYIAKSLRKLNNLKVLYLKLSVFTTLTDNDPALTDNGLEHLRRAFGSLAKLEVMYIGLGGREMITDNGMQLLFKGHEHFTSNLRELGLYLSKVNFRTDEGRLMELISKLSSLQKLSLFLTDKGAQITFLSKTLSKLTNLRFLQLFLVEPSFGIENVELYSLGKSIRNLKLEELQLAITVKEKDSNITQDDLLKFMFSLTSKPLLERLRFLRLGFYLKSDFPLNAKGIKAQILEMYKEFSILYLPEVLIEVRTL